MLSKTGSFQSVINEKQTHRETLADVSLSFSRSYRWTRPVVDIGGHVASILTKL